MKLKFHPKDMWYILPMFAYRPGGYLSIGWLCVSVYVGIYRTEKS